ncbi:MAG: cell division protein ZapA [Alphaproteobacteria bacterium]
MAQVNLQINGRDYLIACEDGEEKHLTFLAEYINHQVEGLVENVGQVGEARLLLMASLVVADELAETNQELDAIKEGETVAPDPDGVVDREALDKLSARIEDIAARLESD